MTADWFKHDAGARRDPKITTLRSIKGDAFAYYYWALIEVLTESKSNEVPRKFYPGVASDIGITLATFRELIDALVDLELIVEDDTGLFSPGHKARMAEYQEKRDAYSAAAKVREEKRRAAKNQTPKPDQNSGTIVPEQGHEASTLIYSNLLKSDQINSDQDLKSKKPPTVPIELSDGTGSLGPIPEPPQTLIVAEASPWAVHAEQQLVPHDDKRLNSDSRYINAGWRPMRQYPLLWMSSSQFCDACEQLEDAGLSFDEGHFSRVFKKANAEIERLKAAGDRHDKKSAYAYITGWAKQRVIEELKSESDLERSKTYTQRSKVRNEQRR